MRNPEDAEDRVQDAFIKAYQSLPGFRRDARFATWLYAIARNTCLMHMRRKSLPTLSLDRPKACEDGTVEHDVPDPAADADEQMMRKELVTVLSLHVGRLSPLNRAVFELRLVQGLSTEETARFLGLSVPAVKSRLHTVRVDLRAGLSTYLKTGCCSV
jgi:RNA polymerase sigma-70 factor (ECF subfamily)